MLVSDVLENGVASHTPVSVCLFHSSFNAHAEPEKQRL
jgi:hypothetical protein